MGERLTKLKTDCKDSRDSAALSSYRPLNNLIATAVTIRETDGRNREMHVQIDKLKPTRPHATLFSFISRPPRSVRFPWGTQSSAPHSKQTGLNKISLHWLPLCRWEHYNPIRSRSGERTAPSNQPLSKEATTTKIKSLSLKSAKGIWKWDYMSVLTLTISLFKRETSVTV